MRIDEFSNPNEIDGKFKTNEKTQFLTFGFDNPIQLLGNVVSLDIEWKIQNQLNKEIEWKIQNTVSINTEWNIIGLLSQDIEWSINGVNGFIIFKQDEKTTIFKKTKIKSIFKSKKRTTIFTMMERKIW